MEGALDSDHPAPARMAKGEPERVLVGFGSAVDQEGAGEPLRSPLHQAARRAGTDLQRHDVALEEERLRLLRQHREEPRVAVAEQGHGMAAVEVDQLPAVAGVEQRAFPPYRL